MTVQNRNWGCVVSEAFSHVVNFRLEESFGLYPARLQISGVLKETATAPQVGDVFSCVYYSQCDEQSTTILFDNLRILSIVTDTFTNITTIEAVSEDYFWETESFSYEQEYDLANGVSLSNFKNALESATGWTITVKGTAGFNWGERQYREIEYDGTIRGAIEYLGMLIGAIPHTDYRNKLIIFYTDLPPASAQISENLVGAYMTATGYKGVRVYGKLNHKMVETSQIDSLGNTFWEEQYRKSDLEEFYVPRESWRVIGYYDQGMEVRGGAHISSSAGTQYLWEAVIKREIIAFATYKQDEVILASTQPDKSPIVLTYETTGTYHAKGKAEVINMSQTNTTGDVQDLFAQVFHIGEEGVEVAVIYDEEDPFGFIIGVHAYVPIASFPLKSTSTSEPPNVSSVDITEATEIYIYTAILNFLQTIKFKPELSGIRIEFGYGVEYGEEPFYTVQNNHVASTQQALDFAKIIYAMQNTKYAHEYERINDFVLPCHPSEQQNENISGVLVSKSTAIWKPNSFLHNRFLVRYVNAG